MKKFVTAILVLVLVLAAVIIPGHSIAQQQCEGPPELCAQVMELQEKLAAQRVIASKEKGEQTAEEKAKAAEQEVDAAKAVGLAAMMAVFLKALLSALKGWKSFFTTDKGKAWLKIMTVVIGFAAFFLTNVGFGIPWWQSLIVAGGGPGAILVHELMKLFPVLMGNKPLPADSERLDSEEEEDEDPPPSDQDTDPGTDQPPKSE